MELIESRELLFKSADRNNYLKVTECEAVGRASELNCQYGEKLGCAR